MMTAKEIGLDIHLKEVDLTKNEQMKPEFLEINPHHTVPTMVDKDNNLTLWESRAIMTYLVDTCSPGHSLYPDDRKTRAIIDRILFFDCGTLQPTIGRVMCPIMSGNPYDKEKVPDLKKQLKFLDDTLAKQKFLVNDDNYTVADLAIFAEMFYLEALDITIDDLMNLNRWYKGMKESCQSSSEINEPALKFFRDATTNASESK